MIRTDRLPLVSLAGLLAVVACADAGDSAGVDDEAALVERARGIHERVITIDTHVDISARNFTAETNYTQNIPGTQVDLPTMEEGGLDVAWLIVYTGQGLLTDEGYAGAYANADEKFEAIRRLVTEIAPERMGLATTSDEVRALQTEGRKVAMIGVENAYPVGTDLSRIQEFFDRGARYMSLSHNGHSQFSDSNTGERDGEWLHGDGVTTGLSDLGREALAEMNRVGIMVDVSHPSKGAFMEMAELSEAPLMASHSSSRAMNDHSRNLDDEQLRLLAESGGVIQTVAFQSYVNAEKNSAHGDALRGLRAEIAAELGFEPMSRGEQQLMTPEAFEAYLEEQRLYDEAVDARASEVFESAPPVDVADFVDHIDYMVDLIGIDHVGISSDFDGGGGVHGWDDASETFNVTLELVRRGYTEEEIAKLWGGNLLRVLDETLAVAARLQAEAAQE
jgi:microsomal dipeptidase-like Zn-dependent dipeptidase